MATPKQSVGSLLTFGVNNGYLEGILKGFKLGLITQHEYANICQCENTKGGYTYFIYRFYICNIIKNTWRPSLLLQYFFFRMKLTFFV